MTEPSNLFLLTEAASRTGLSVDALRKRIRRGHLETVKGNDGLVRVRLPDSHRLDDVQPEPSRPDERDRTIKALEGELATVREALQRERAHADEAAGLAARERDRAEGAMIRAAASEAEVKGLREALDEARKPFWRRWIG